MTKEKEFLPAEIREPKEQIEKPKDLVVSCYQTLQCAVGQERDGLAEHIIIKTACAIDPRSIDTKSAHLALESMDEQKPKDAVEAKLVSQATALYSNGMDFLSRAAKTDRPEFMHVFGNIAVKYLRLHNETIESLGKYRRGGEQKVTVVHVAEKMAVVNNYGGGGNTKNEGGSPCNTRNAEQNAGEPAQVSHVKTTQLPGLEDVGCTAEKAPAQRPKKAVNA